jgi:hypothetical protein
MKKQLVTTENTKLADGQVRKILSRSPERLRGMMLVYGAPGHGKTEWAELTAFSKQWMYIRLIENCTAKWFLSEVYRRLTLKADGVEREFRGTLAELESACIDIFADHPEYVMMIDEINLAIQFKHWRVLEIIRDFADLSFATFIMIGEQDTKVQVENYNKHFFDRCMFFVQFLPNTIEDYRNVVKAVSPIALDDELIAEMHKRTKGNLRQWVKTIESFELLAKSKGLKALQIKDFAAGGVNEE